MGVADSVDIGKLLKGGWLAGLDLNSRVLNPRLGFSPHMAMIYEKFSQSYKLYDSGLPPKPGRVAASELLLKAWQYAGKKNTALIVVRRQNAGNR